MVENTNRKKCIFLPGDLTGSFVVNELQFLKDAFDEVFVLAYIENEGSFDEILSRFSFKGELIKKPNITAFDMLKWNRLEYVSEEKKTAMHLGHPSLITFAKRWVYLQMYGAYSVASEPIIDREIANFEGDVYIYSFWLSRPAFSAAQFKNRVKKIVSRAHGYDLYEYRNATEYLPFRKYIQEGLDEIYFISEDGRNYFEKLLEKKSVDKNIGANHSISRLGTFKDDGFKSTDIANSKQDKVVIASCSSVVGLKRLDLIIETVRKLQEKIGANCVRWIHLGDGPLIDEIKNLAKERLAEGSYEFRGNVPNDEVIKIYISEGVRFFINLSDYEGVPVSIMEAMSAGLFPIARNVGGISEIVDNECGLLLDDVEETNRVTEFIETHKEDEFAEKAYKKWETTYNAINNYNKFFEEIVS